LAVPDASLYPFAAHLFACTRLGALGLLKLGDRGAASSLQINTTNTSH
jgi:hypothetical protein